MIKLHWHILSTRLNHTLTSCSDDGVGPLESLTFNHSHRLCVAASDWLFVLLSSTLGKHSNNFQNNEAGFNVSVKYEKNALSINK